MRVYAMPQDIIKKANENPSNKFVYLDIKLGNEKAGRVIIELYYNIAPKTAENFRCLVTGEKGIGTFGKPLNLKNTKFHRIVPCFMVQGGDIINMDGTGGESIYGPIFEDENFNKMHNEEGIVGMANKGPNTNSSQFYITTELCHHLDGRNVAFGKVIRGLNVIKEMVDVPRNDDVPLEPCLIEDCGELKDGEPLDVSERDNTEDTFPPWPDDWEIETEKQPDEFIKAANIIKNSGNFYYKNKHFHDAHRKYKKAIRYIEHLEKKQLPFNEKDARTIKVTTMLNFAAVKLKKGKHLDAFRTCDKILSINPNNKKGLFRRAQARVGLKEYDEALNDLQQLLKLYPKEKEVITEFENVRKLKRNYLLKEKMIFSKMFKNI